jgi:hypothetical protein
MVYFQTKNPNLGKFWRALDWKMLVYFMNIKNIFTPFGICILWPLGNLMVFWYVFHRFGKLFQEKIWQPCRARL